MADLTATLALSALVKHVEKLSTKLDQRATRYQLLDRYYEGASEFPAAVSAAKMTNAYRRLMPVADAPWGALIVDSVLDRLEVGGIRSDDKAANEAVWGVWQDNQMDSESKLAHCATAIAGRSYALVWPDPDNGNEPAISLDSAEQMIVEYEEGSRRKRVAALRRWVDEGRTTYANLYLPDGIYKFQQVAEERRQKGDASWVQRTVARPDGTDEPWPVPNDFGVVPVVELAVNRRLKPGCFGHARGEYEHCLGLIDRCNLLTFLGLVVAFWMGFPLRGVIGDRILRDDDNEPIKPFDSNAGELVQIENPEAKLVELSAADRGNLSIYPELSQLAAITKTPRHYFPLAQSMVNISADAIRADEGGLNAKVIDHKGSIGEGWEEVLRLCGLMSPTEVKLSPRASLLWKDHESRSLAEKADAAVKLNGILPWQAIVELCLNASQDDVRRWQAQRSSDALSQLLSAATQPASNGTAPAAAPGTAAADSVGVTPTAPSVGSGGGPAGRETRPPRANEPRV